MTWEKAIEVARFFGLKLPKFDSTAPVAQCWIDRVEWLARCEDDDDGTIAEAIEECNRYSGQRQ